MRIRVVLPAVAAAALALPGIAVAGPPEGATCLALGAGSTGLLAVGGEIPSSDQLAGRPGGFGPVAHVPLPDRVVIKTRAETFSNEYAFVLRDGVVYVRPARLGVGVPGEPWRLLELPACLAGRVTEISADHRLLLALGRDRQLYSHDMPGGDLSPERWTWRWGPYFWTGAGMRMPGRLRSWATSELTSAERFRDSSGRERTAIGVATVYLLREDGRRITYLDPWLPADESREVCGPRRGTVELAALSASGSTVFAVSRRGELFARLYDFDVSGANTVFGRYSWERDRPASDARWQLPGPDWVRLKRPPGTLTDRITIAKTGLGAGDRLLRIEGRTPRGRVGWWEAPIDAAVRRDAWRFVVSGQHLVGIPLSWRGRARQPAPEALRYAGTIAGAPAEVADFHPECSPSTLRVQVAPGVPLELRLHSSDGLRQERRRPGLDDMPREYNGALEVVGPLDAVRRAWVDAHLGGRRIATAPLAVTATRMRFLAQCWQLTLDGRPARPDQPRVPPDLGAAFGRFTEQQADGRGPSRC